VVRANRRYGRYPVSAHVGFATTFCSHLPATAHAGRPNG